MNVEVTKLPESRVALKVELTPEEVDQALERTYKNLVQRLSVPGFRKGKAPRPVVERIVGEEYFIHEATDEAVNWGYRKAVQETDLVPIEDAQIGSDDEGHDHGHNHLAPGEVFKFEASVTVKPDVQLPDYHGIQVQRPVVDVSESDVDELLDDIQTRTATLEPVNRPAELGDVVTMNVTGTVDGDEAINQENADFELRDETVGSSDPYLPGLSSELLGKSAGDILEPVLSLPEAYPNDAMAGKTLTLRILVKEVKRKVFAELNDEFAQSVSELQTLAELREALSRNLDVERRIEADQKMIQEAIEAVTSRTFIDIPPVLIEEELDGMVSEMRERLAADRLQLDQFLQATGQSEADLRREMREEATNGVKRWLVLDAIAAAEGVEVSAREVDAAVEDLLRGRRMSEPERRKFRTSTALRSNLRSRIARQRAIQKLVEIVSGGDVISPEAAELAADGSAEDTQETVPVEVGG